MTSRNKIFPISAPIIMKIGVKVRRFSTSHLWADFWPGSRCPIFSKMPHLKKVFVRSTNHLKRRVAEIGVLPPENWQKPPIFAPIFQFSMFEPIFDRVPVVRSSQKCHTYERYLLDLQIIRKEGSPKSAPFPPKIGKNCRFLRRFFQFSMFEPIFNRDPVVWSS